jgi:hypothetical protein
MKKIQTTVFLCLSLILGSCNNNDLLNAPPTEFIVITEDLNFSTANLTWTESIDPEETDIIYSVFLEGVLQNSLTSRNYTLTGLQANNMYNGKVVATDEDGIQTESPFSISTSEFPFPSDFEITVISTAPFTSRIDWTPSTDVIGRQIVYNVYIGDILVGENITQPEFWFDELKGLTQYIGRVNAINPDGNITSKPFDFTTDIKVYDTTLQFENQEQIDVFVARGFNLVDDNMIIGNYPNNLEETDITDISGLSSLIEITGSELIINRTQLSSLQGLANLVSNNENLVLTVTNNSQLVNLNGLGNFEILHDFFLTENPILNDTSGLTNLQRVRFQFFITFNNSLVNITLPSIQRVRSFHIENNDLLQSVSGLSTLQEIDAVLYLLGNPVLQNFNGFNALDYIPELIISDCDAITSVQGFDSLARIGTLTVTDNENLVSFSDFSSLVRFENISISRNPSLQSFDGFQNVTFTDNFTTRHEIIITDNNAIQNLNEFSNYTFEWGKIFIDSNTSLSDFCGLQLLFTNIVQFEGSNNYATNNAYNPSVDQVINGPCSN